MGKRVGSVVGLVAMSLLAACSSFGAEDEETKQPDGTGTSTTPNPREGAPPPAGATPMPSELTEKFGYFVAEKGNDESGDGSRAKPFATINKALSKSKVDGKRVYVCGGKYIESVTLEDGISMIGGYDCSQPEWSPSAKKSRIESPTSPALRAKDIKSLTRFEGFDVVAPDATEPSGSSIGLIAEGSDKLVIVSSRIVAGSGAAGKAGVEGVQLVQTGAIDGRPGAGEAIWCRSFDGKCPALGNPKADGPPAGGVSVCAGAAGFNGGSGGAGGHGGMYKASRVIIGGGAVYVWTPVTTASTGDKAKSGAAGSVGASAGPTLAMGTLTADGYAAADGEQGKSGGPGEGGAGADGAGPPNQTIVDKLDEYWHARAGGGGGGGGCPGVAGSPGKGGGASIGVLLFESPVQFEKAEIVSGAAGAGGRGTFGSRPTPGGNGGAGASGAGLAGGAGGEAGVSGSGAGGPSLAIAHRGPAPKLLTSTTKPGAGGHGVAEETSADGKTLPASPAGESKEIFAF